MSGVRLDQKLVELGHFESREKARATIMSGLVFVNGQRADKPGMAVYAVSAGYLAAANLPAKDYVVDEIYFSDIDYRK